MENTKNLLKKLGTLKSGQIPEEKEVTVPESTKDVDKGLKQVAETGPASDKALSDPGQRMAQIIQKKMQVQITNFEMKLRELDHVKEHGNVLT